MITRQSIVAALVILSLAVCGEAPTSNSTWTFRSARLASEPAVELPSASGVHVMRVPSKSCCGWWETHVQVVPGGGVRFQATAEIAMDAKDEFVHNDVMMFVRWDFPKDGKDRGKSGNGVDRGKFYQRDFVVYTDKVVDGRIVRTFDETYAVPGECSSVEVEFIAKWHTMTVAVRDLKAASVERPKPRVVRCVVGNPHERTGNIIINSRLRAGEVMTGEKTMAVHLAQIEACLTNIFANVQKPDIILFAECLSTQGSPDPASVAEPVPGGPSWALAEKYAKKYKTYIAMNVREREANGQCHNTVFVCGRDGSLAGLYRKSHLTSGEYQMGLVPGDGFPVFDLDFGRVGALVCWDNWFSESIKMIKRNGAELLLFPLAGCAPDHVELVFPARAIDSGIPILVAMRQGHLPNGIIDRDGTWIAKTFDDCGYAVADLDLNERKRTFWLSVGPGMGDPYELYYDESRPELYEKFDWRQPRR